MIQIKYLEQILAQNKYSPLEVLRNSFAQLQNQKYGEGKTVSNIIFIMLVALEKDSKLMPF